MLTRTTLFKRATLFMTATGLLGALLVTVALVQADPHIGGDTIKRTFKVRPGGTIYLDIDRGNVTIEASGDDAVYVELERRIEGADRNKEKMMLEKHKWSIEQEGNDVLVESRYNDARGGWTLHRRKSKNNFRLEVTIYVPETYNVDFHTGAGNVDIDDLYGAINGKTGAGNVTVGKVVGSMEIATGSGNIAIEQMRGPLEVRSGAGNISIEAVAGEISAHTGAGDIVATLTDQPDDDSELKTGAGNVKVYMDEDIAVDVDAQASVGSAECEFGLRVRGKWMSKSCSGSVNGGGPALTLRSGVGSISLLRR